MDLSPYRGRNRLFLILAPSPSDRSHERQQRLLVGTEASFEDRDLLTIRLFEDGSGEAMGEPISPEEAAEARDSLGVDAGRFAIILVGKDGGAKFRSDEPIAPQEIFARIDAMPMRRREMRERNTP